MRLTKYGHSCVLVELESGGQTRRVLFDPGAWSRVPVTEIESLDEIVVSHVHGDHCDTAVISELLQRFPNAAVIGPEEVVAELKNKAGIATTSSLPVGMQAFTAPHEEVRPFGAAVPQELGVHLAGMYTHPGDSHSFSETMAVLALPIVAPWGSTRRAVELALALKPQYVLPVHDWFLTDEAREWTYSAAANVLEPAGVMVLRPVDGKPIELLLPDLQL